MQQDEVQFLNLSAIPCPETIFYAKYELQKSESEAILQDLYELEASLSEKSRIFYVLDGSLFLYSFDSIPLLPGLRPSTLTLNSSGSFGRSSFFHHESNPRTSSIQLNLIRALRRLTVYHLCKEYGFLSLKEFLLPIRTASKFILEGLSVHEFPLLGLHLGFLTDGFMEFSFRPVGLSLYCLSNIANLEEYVVERLILLPFGCNAKLISIQAPSSLSTMEILKSRYGFFNLPTEKWVGVQVDCFDYAFSWPLSLCFLEKTPFPTHLQNDFDKHFTINGYTLPFNASKDLLSEKKVHLDQNKEVISDSDNLDHTVSPNVAVTPVLPNTLAIPSSPELPIRVTHSPFPSSERVMEESDRENDLFMQDIEDARITEADFDYFDLPNPEVKPYSENMEVIEQKSESLNQVDLEAISEEKQLNNQQFPSPPDTYTQSEHSIQKKESTKSISEPTIPQDNFKLSIMDDLIVEKYYHDEVVPPLYNAVPFPSSSVDIAKKYSIGGKYWCPSALLHRSDSLGSLSGSVSSVEEEKHFYDGLREVVERQPVSEMKNNINPEVSFPSLEKEGSELYSSASVDCSGVDTGVNDSFGFESLLEKYGLKHLKMVEKEALLELIMSQPFYFYLLPFWKNQNSYINSYNDSCDFLYIQEATKEFLEGLFSGLSRAISLSSCTSWETEINGNNSKDVNKANTYITSVDQPGVILKSNNQKLTVDYNATKHWSSLNLQPYNETRNYTVLPFSQKKPESIPIVKSLFDDIRYAYENCQFGKLELGNLITFQEDGIIDYNSLFSSSFCDSGDQATEHKSTLNFTNLAKECASAYANDDLLFLFFVDDSVYSFFSVCQSFTLLNEVFSLETKKDGLFNNQLFIKIIPSSAGFTISQPLATETLSPTNIAMDIYSTSPLRNPSLKVKYSPFVMEKPVISLLNYKLSNTFSANAVFNDYSLHVTYTVIRDKFLICMWNDTYGELENCEWFLLSETNQKLDVFQKIWKTSSEIMKIGSFTWSLNIMKVGALSLEELNDWKQVAESQEFMDKSTLVIGNCLIHESSKPQLKPYLRMFFRSSNNPDDSLEISENIEIVGIVREAATLIPHFTTLDIKPCLAYGSLGFSESGNVVPIADIHLFYVKQTEPVLALRKILREYLFMSFTSRKNNFSSIRIPHNISTVLYQRQLLEYLSGDDH
ncbi:mediator complex subunit Srb9 [Schizosaccharomyces cryophilus OY26]|uniref:Mediator of RNA polymerase II transcription subunit 13 n=1 Tax=Schizosaccharomyces cryophilus (strain OY26 / ATCC MYA-4695 / CBS 11777 / NBRC 106824 / NRRL Y48691) TaxID=653667 RepID=S9W0K0_SCHCR|nr:mediator complex subunit Srb9 [Schizosaccharomyces cryophilus OY26]EPY53353.1 mediator complex subunit Srb9 [Schizosaccharomyces cryophilus OY26]